MEKKTQDYAISAISLGCDKNKVDLEKMLGRLEKAGFKIVADAESADAVIVNTCAFIQPAKTEAISEILGCIDLKTRGVIQKVVVTGCFAERYASERDLLPEVDRFVLLRENGDIVKVMCELFGIAPPKKEEEERVLTSGSAYAYLKIADGCNNVCSFCAIPRIRGRYKSLPIDTLVDEAKNLAARGIKELILVAQDTTRYGEDIYGKPMLVELCQKLERVKGIEWIRLHYAYPEKVDEPLLDFISSSPKMCKYIDIPLQHIDDKILSSMRRKTSEQQVRALVKLIHEKYPEIAIRSTFIVGYPGEEHKDFAKLLSFLREAKIDLAGFFPYFREEGTAAYYMKGQHKKFVKNHRLKKALKVQREVSTALAREKIGKTEEVLVDYFDDQTGEFVAHSNFLSPTVDFCVRFVDNGAIKIGDFVKVKYFDFDGSAFKGEIV